MTDVERRDLLEVIEDRNDRTSTVITTQVPTKTWPMPSPIRLSPTRSATDSSTTPTSSNSAAPQFAGRKPSSQNPTPPPDPNPVAALRPRSSPSERLLKSCRTRCSSGTEYARPLCQLGVAMSPGTLRSCLRRSKLPRKPQRRSCGLQASARSAQVAALRRRSDTSPTAHAAPLHSGAQVERQDLAGPKQETRSDSPSPSSPTASARGMTGSRERVAPATQEASRVPPVDRVSETAAGESAHAFAAIAGRQDRTRAAPVDLTTISFIPSRNEFF
jgi:hypothetical protein